MTVNNSKEEHPQYRRIIEDEYPTFKNCPSVSVTNEEIDRCMDRAREVVDSMYSDSMNPNQIYDARVATRTTGLLGEIAFARHYGYSTTMQADVSGDGGFDFMCHKTDQDVTPKVDVKTICKYKGDLFIPEHHQLNANLYYLVERRGKDFGICGFATKHQVSNGELKDIDCITRVVSRGDLHEPFDKDVLNIIHGESEVG